MTGNIAKVLLVAILLAAIVSCTPNSPATGKVNIEEVTEAVSDALSTNFVINGIKSRSLKGENLGQMLSYILSNDDEFLNEYSSALENLETSPAFDISSNESQYGKLRMWGEIAQSDTVINGEMHLSLILPSSQRIELSIENMTENLEKRSVDAAFTLVDEREHDGTLVSFHMSQNESSYSMIHIEDIVYKGQRLEREDEQKVEKNIEEMLNSSLDADEEPLLRPGSVIISGESSSYPTPYYAEYVSTSAFSFEGDVIMEGFRISDKSENVIAYLLTSFEKSGEYSGTGFFSLDNGLKDSVRFLTLKGYRNEHYYDRTKEENSQKAKESAINEIRSILTSAKIEPEKDEAYLKLAKDDSSYLVELLIDRADNSVDAYIISESFWDAGYFIYDYLLLDLKTQRGLVTEITRTDELNSDLSVDEVRGMLISDIGSTTFIDSFLSNTVEENMPSDFPISKDDMQGQLDISFDMENLSLSSYVPGFPYTLNGRFEGEYSFYGTTVTKIKPRESYIDFQGDTLYLENCDYSLDYYTSISLKKETLSLLKYFLINRLYDKTAGCTVNEERGYIDFNMNGEYPVRYDITAETIEFSFPVQEDFRVSVQAKKDGTIEDVQLYYNYYYLEKTELLSPILLKLANDIKSKVDELFAEPETYEGGLPDPDSSTYPGLYSTLVKSTVYPKEVSIPGIEREKGMEAYYFSIDGVRSEEYPKYTIYAEGYKFKRGNGDYDTVITDSNVYYTTGSWHREIGSLSSGAVFTSKNDVAGPSPEHDMRSYALNYMIATLDISELKEVSCDYKLYPALGDLNEDYYGKNPHSGLFMKVYDGVAEHLIMYVNWTKTKERDIISVSIHPGEERDNDYAQYELDSRHFNYPTSMIERFLKEKIE